MAKAPKKKTALKPPALPEQTPENRAVLDEAKGVFVAIGRRTTKDAFDLGWHLLRVKEILEEKDFNRWVTAECRITMRLARGYVAVKSNLGAHRERLEASAVSPTILYTLAHADSVKIDTVITAIESGQRLTVAKVKQIVAGETERKVRARPNFGGAAGLRLVVEAKVKGDLDLFSKLTKLILTLVEEAAKAIKNGKHVTKTSLAGRVDTHSMKAAELLSNAIAPISSAHGPQAGGAYDGSVWAKVRRVLYKLGDPPRWPAKEDFPAWVVGEVLPILRFAVLGEPMAGSQDESATVGGQHQSMAEDEIPSDAEISPAALPNENVEVPTSPSDFVTADFDEVADAQSSDAKRSFEDA